VENISENFDKLGYKIRNSKDPYLASLYLMDTYNYAKKVVNNDNKNDVSYYILGNEQVMPSEFILKVNANYDFANMYRDERGVNIDSFTSVDKLLDYIVFITRYYLVSRYKPGFIEEKGAINMVDTINLCYYTSKKVKKLCDLLKVKCELIRIDPAFNMGYNLLNGYGHHYFNILTIEDQRYIIDCTYKQFFDVIGGFLEKMGIYGTTSPFCGIYMLMDDGRKQTAIKLLQDGWMPMNENNMKNYFDGFALSYRNALYYENLGYIDYNTGYTANDYENFLFGDDDQAKHEDIAHLGKQKIIIKKPKLIFRTDATILEGIKNK